MSVIVTTTVHYMAYFSLIFRARRIFLIADLERQYFDEIYDVDGVLDTINSESASVDGKSEESAPHIMEEKRRRLDYKKQRWIKIENQK